MNWQRLTLIAASAIVCVGLGAWNAKALVGAGAAQLGTAAETVKPAENAACRGWGAHCPPGVVWNGHRCVPC